MQILSHILFSLPSLLAVKLKPPKNDFSHRITYISGFFILSWFNTSVCTLGVAVAVNAINGTPAYFVRS